jgi:hypothetical protein
VGAALGRLEGLLGGESVEITVFGIMLIVISISISINITIKIIINITTIIDRTNSGGWQGITTNGSTNSIIPTDT